MEAMNVSTRIPDFHSWLEAKLGIHFEIRTTPQHPCCKFNSHNPRFPGVHPPGYARYDAQGKDKHEVWAWNEAPEALAVIAHEAVELTWMRDKKRADPNSIDGMAQDFEIDKEAKRLVNEYIGP